MLHYGMQPTKGIRSCPRKLWVQDIMKVVIVQEKPQECENRKKKKIEDEEDRDEEDRVSKEGAVDTKFWRPGCHISTTAPPVLNVNKIEQRTSGNLRSSSSQCSGLLLSLVLVLISSCSLTITTTYPRWLEEVQYFKIFRSLIMILSAWISSF